MVDNFIKIQQNLIRYSPRITGSLGRTYLNLLKSSTKFRNQAKAKWGSRGIYNASYKEVQSFVVDFFGIA